jgi:hypothetical protein
MDAGGFQAFHQPGRPFIPADACSLTDSMAGDDVDRLLT